VAAALSTLRDGHRAEVGVIAPGFAGNRVRGDEISPLHDDNSSGKNVIQRATRDSARRGAVFSPPSTIVLSRMAVFRTEATTIL
jgi:hypothetical protein